MGIYNDCNGEKYLVEAKLEAWRIVEDQSRSTTRKFVDTSLEHDLLEKLIDESKPEIKYYDDEVYFKKCHYLIFTPFRYPPLKWGSRFGSRWERGIFYGALDLETAMSEKAFYRLAFLQASEGNIGGKTLLSTAFKTNVESAHFINLCKIPFKTHKNKISAKDSWTFSQALGKEMRENKVECFEYISARSKKEGHNIGVFSPKALINNSKLEKTFEYYNCYATKELVEFTSRTHVNPSHYTFSAQEYLVNNKMPLPPS